MANTRSRRGTARRSAVAYSADAAHAVVGTEAALARGAAAAIEAGRPETVRVRMTVDLVGPLAVELENTAARLGKTKTEVVRDGLTYVFHALKARNDGYLVGAWKEEADGKVSRSREFTIGH